MATDTPEAVATSVVGKGSASDCAVGVGEAVGVSEGKGNSDGSKEVEIGLVSGDGSTLLAASAELSMFTIAS